MLLFVMKNLNFRHMPEYLHPCKWQLTASYPPSLMSLRAKSPTLMSPLTYHFWVSRLGPQLWFMKRDMFPFGPASMILVCGRMSVKYCEMIYIVGTKFCGFTTMDMFVGIWFRGYQMFCYTTLFCEWIFLDFKFVPIHKRHKIKCLANNNNWQ